MFANQQKVQLQM